MSYAFNAPLHRFQPRRKRPFKRFALKTFVLTASMTTLLCGFLGSVTFRAYPANLAPTTSTHTIELSDSISLVNDTKNGISAENSVLLPVTASEEPIISEIPMVSETPTESKKPTMIEDSPVVTINDTVPYDFMCPVPLSEPVDLSYFDDALFIGNSQTEGFMLYSGLGDVTAFTDRGLKVDSVFTKKNIQTPNGKVPIMTAFAKETGYTKVYLLFGINELGWAYSNLFIEDYGKVIDEIRRSNPDVTLYIQSILPVSLDKSTSNDLYTKEHIDAFNVLIQQLAFDKQAYFIDMNDALADSEGYLPEGSSFDGIHLKKPYCEKWLTYLQTHTAPTIQQ